MLNDVIFAWGESVNPNPPAGLPTISVSAWPHLFNQTWLRWDTSSINNVPEAVRTAKVAFVNLFHTPDSIHVQQIKQVNPNCYVLAMPDAPLEHVLGESAWRGTHRQMVLADAIAPRTQADCDVYGTLFNKPTYWLPSPIGPTEFFAPYRDLPKEDYILTLDHALSLPNTYCNVAAVAAVQRATGMRVVYAAERDTTRQYAALARLNCEFKGYVPWKEFIELTARAKICIDIYAAHSYGRQNVMCAMVGTPCVGSDWTMGCGHPQVDPFRPLRAVHEVKSLLNDLEYYQAAQRLGYFAVEGSYSVEASRHNLINLLEQIGVTA